MSTKTIIDKCKDSPKSIMSIGASIGLVVAIATFIYQFDDRYALREDVAKIKEQNEQVLTMLNSYRTTRITLLRLKIASDNFAPEDKVELEILENL